jgi:hypothetical protein
VLLGSLPCAGFSQKMHAIYPSETDPAISVIHGPHLVFNPASKAIRKLVISFPGTNSDPAVFKGFDSIAATLGYHALSLDYDNRVITTVCRPSADSSCFDAFRQEIGFGTPVSSLTHVDSANSIYHRIYSALKFLTVHDPGEGWNYFFNGDKILWENIVTTGHSQGAGHAAFFGKSFSVYKVIILAGPQDFMDVYHKPAGWIRATGKTNPSKFKALLHIHDEYGFEKQLECCRILSESLSRDTMAVEKIRDSKTARIFVSHESTHNAHGSVLSSSQWQAWKVLLEN